MVKIVGKIEISQPLVKKEQEKKPVSKTIETEVLINEKGLLYILNLKGFGIGIHPKHIRDIKQGEVWLFSIEDRRAIPLEKIMTAEEYQKKIMNKKISKLQKKYDR